MNEFWRIIGVCLSFVLICIFATWLYDRETGKFVALLVFGLTFGGIVVSILMVLLCKLWGVELD